ncbi:T-box transcription factor TBX6 [Pseudolycoriella hygida]|uniref:T-box transcription factor TBX6 n=1 Tax=Pseudolycoriella hygida TaxID=35572 RepID=A0A9Q0N1D8_9DIPT|nr:T-box transcription factor TBX6 [Pseudolycoriella hygida]
MTELMDFNFWNEICRQQMMQRLPDPYPTMLPVPVPRQMPIAHRYRMNQGLPGVTVKLQNADLWAQFHEIGTEMIITKSGRRMFPSLRVSLSGLEDDVNYCVFLEMVPTGDCRYKFSGSQWMPAGGAEPQSQHRICLHPDSPALGSHWSAQPVLFNKVKLTNNTLDNSGHIVLTSMHKYQPRLIVVQTSDPNQLTWAPYQSFTFPETEFVAVTAYQNDRITRLKIDNNPFAKGFRETGQSRCKRKLTQSTSSSSTSLFSSTSSTPPISSSSSPLPLPPENKKTIKESESTFNELDAKRQRANSCNDSLDSIDDCEQSSGSISPISTISGDIQIVDEDDRRFMKNPELFYQHFSDRHHHPQYPAFMSLAFSYLTRSYPPYYPPIPHDYVAVSNPSMISISPQMVSDMNNQIAKIGLHPPSPSKVQNLSIKPRKKCGFTISAILGCEV